MKIPDFELERFFAEWEFAAPHLLCASDVQGWAMRDLLALADEEMREMWDGLTLGYTEAPGHPLLRAEIASLYDGVTADDVLVFAGAEEAIFAAMNVLVGHGDRAVATWPAYQSLIEVARAAGADVDLLRLRHEDGWRVDTDELHRLVRPATRVVTVNFPHNPTGALPDAATFREVAAIAEKAGAHLFSDEVYRYLEPTPADRLPAAVEVSERGVSLGVMSKSFALAGLRIGWIACRDRALLARLAAFKDYTTICSSAPSEVLAIIALRARERVLERTASIVRPNLALLDDFFARWAGVLEWVRPRGGSTAFPRFVVDAPIDSLAADLREKAGVLILPGTLLGHGGNHFRIGFGRTNMPEALVRFDEYLAARFGNP
jgi:aspartate/methionine/tyrosine aminotransferase